ANEDVHHTQTSATEARAEGHGDEKTAHMSDGRRALPSVSRLLESAPVRSLLESTPRSVVVDAVRRAIDDARSKPEAAPASEQAWSQAIAVAIADATRPSLRRVINGTGVALHTN